MRYENPDSHGGRQLLCRLYTVIEKFFSPALADVNGVRIAFPAMRADKLLLHAVKLASILEQLFRS